MPAAIAIPLIIGAASTAAQVYGAHKAAGASKDAAKTQSDAANKALDYSQRTTNDTLGYLRSGQMGAAQSYQPSGTRSALGSLVGVPAGGMSYGATTNSPNTGINGGSPFTMPGQPPQQPPQQNGGMVLMRAPNGMQKRVNAADVAHFTQLGATVIQ